MKTTSVLAASLLTAVLSSPAGAADPPATVNYQGVLRDAADKPRNGTFDMVYRFHDASTGGTEILVDSHTAGNANAVTVTGGLFNVLLGGGTVTDGSGGGTYTSLGDVFRDYGSVFLGITIGGETLSPRVKIQSAAYALNATHLQGKPAATFLDTSANFQQKSGPLRVTAEGADVNLASFGMSLFHGPLIGGAFTNDWDGGSEVTLANYGEGIQARGSSFGGSFGSDSGVGYATMASGNTGISAYGTYPERAGYFKDSSYTGEVYLGQGDTGIIAKGSWSAGEFDSTTGYFAALGSAAYGSAGYFTNTNAGAYTYLLPTVFLDTYGILAYGTIGGYFSSSQGIYAMVATSGSGITSNGTKNFIQNHPHQSDRVVMYTALEGPEAGTYTRGSGRIRGGEARIALDPTFAWTTDPDVGLTAVVTARSAGADLYVVSASTKELVVRSGAVANGEVDFDYVVNGLRLGFENQPAIVPIEDFPSATVPTLDSSEKRLAERPEDTRASTPLARFTSERLALGGSVPDLSGARKLIEGINSEEHARFAKTVRPSAAKPAQGGTAVPMGQAAPAIPSRSQGAGSAAPATAPRDSVRSVAVPIEPDATPGTPVGTFLVPVAGEVEPGDVLANDPGTPGSMRHAEVAADPGVVGIVGGVEGSRFSGNAPIALAGTVTRCRVDASYAPILVNDLLVASPTPGTAMNGGIDPRQGTVLGKALEPLSSGTGTILVFVMPR